MSEEAERGSQEREEGLARTIGREIGTEVVDRAIATLAVALCIAPPTAIGYLLDPDGAGLVIGLLVGLLFAAAFGVLIAVRGRAWFRERIRSLRRSANG